MRGWLRFPGTSCSPWYGNRSPRTGSWCVGWSCGRLAPAGTWARSAPGSGNSSTPFARYGYVEYADAHGYGEQASQAVSAIAALTAARRPADAISLSREAIRLLSEAQDAIDDSDGHLGRIGAALAEAHLDACRAACPDSDETARWLVGHLLSDLDDLTGIDPLDYEDVLGAQGMGRVRSWRLLPGAATAPAGQRST